MKTYLLILLLLGILSAQNAAAGIVLDSISFLFTVLVPLIALSVILAATLYAIGPLLGSDIRAKANQWSQRIIVGILISLAIISILYFVVPGIHSGSISSSGFDIIFFIENLTDNLFKPLLFGLIILLVILAASSYALGNLMNADTRAKAQAWSNNLIIAAIVVSIVYAILFQILDQTTSSVISANFGSGKSLSKYARIIFDLTILIGIIILITYAAGKILKNPEWEAYLNIEMSNLSVTFMVVLFTIGFFAAANTGLKSLLGISEDRSISEEVIVYLRDDVANNLLLAQKDVYELQTCTSMMNTVSRRSGDAVLTKTYKLFPGIDTFVSVSNVLSNGLFAAFTSISAQIAIFHLTDTLILNFFLPAGLLLRFFPPTRDAGAFLIAASFAGHIILPGVYLINKKIFTDIGASNYKSISTLTKGICLGNFYGIGMLVNPSFNPALKIPGASIVAGAISKAASHNVINGLAMSEFVVIMKNISAMSLTSLFMPSLAVMISTASINALSRFIISKG